MATLSHSESKRLYSWWWDSHISPKNSKWLQENLTDMDAKVKSMIKLIEEDADSFARRAEMYYKKRPELMKLVEEFYRAYRALAERYDHATAELRHAHQTMAKSFPNQAQYMLADYSPFGPSDPGAEPYTTEVPHAFLKSDDLQKNELGPSSSHNNLKRNGGNSEISECGIRNMGPKKLNDLESEEAREAETEVQTLKIALAKIRSEKDDIILLYKNSLEKLSEMERELTKAHMDAGSLNEQASKAEIEIKILKEALKELRSVRDARLVQYNQCLERIASLETMLSLAQQDAEGLDERANKAETEAKNLKEEIFRLEAERDAGLRQYKQSLEKISILETKLSLTEENSKMLNKQIEKADMEVKAMRKHIAELKEEKEAVSVLYKQCLETIAKMESEILHAQENFDRLNREVMMGAEKLKSVEHHCDMLERSNHSLQLEADNLVQKIARKDQELLEKHTELERLQTTMQEEHSRFLQIEAALQALQKLYSQSREEQKSLALELQYGLRLLNDLELSKQGFKEEMQQIVVDNRTLHELNLSATVAINNQQMEISQLKEIKEKLERAIAVKAEESDALQQEIQQIKDQIQGLTKRYQNMLEQAEAVGLNPECFAAAAKELQSENFKLKEAYKREQDEKEGLLEKSKDIDKLSRENALMESSLSRLNNELDGLRSEAMKNEKSCQALLEEKSVHVAEKAALLRQLQIITETMQNLFEKNTLLEKSLADANIELEGLKAKSSSLKVVCESLNNEKANLLNERSILVSQLKTVEVRLSNLEKRFTDLEVKCSDMEKDKESTVHEVEKLSASLLAQKSEHANHKHSSENRLANLENLVHLLQDECQLGKKEFEEQLDKAVNAQLEVFILQKFVEDLEEKNVTLLVECQKYVEASTFSDKVIIELEDENFEQQMEVEFLLDEIKQLKMKIHQVYGALKIDPDCGHDKRNKQEEIPILHILDNIEDMKGSLVKSQEEQQQLLVENSVLLTLLWQLQSDGAELGSKNKVLEHEFEILSEQYAMLKKDELELQEMNRQLRFKVTKGEEKENTLKTELESMHVELIDLQGENLVLEEENSQVLVEKNSLLNSVLELKDALSTTEIENREILREAVALGNLSSVYESFLTQKVFEQKALAENLGILHHVNNNLKLEVGLLREKFEEKVAENVYLSDSVERMDKELHETRNANADLNYQVALKENLLQKKEAELLKMEQRLKVAEALNAEFCRNVTELKIELQESRLIKRKLESHMLELSEDRINQKMEIECLSEANRSYLSEIRLLCQEVEQQRLKEETLNFELLEKTYEFELGESEAVAFYFDLQISSISKALFEDKFKELTGFCMSLEDENAAKSSEIELMRERINLLESEIGGLKGQLSAYIPVISSLNDDLASLEFTALLQSNQASDISNKEHKDIVFETCLQEDSSESLKEDENLVISSGVLDLLNLQRRIRAVHNVLADEIERHVKEQTLTVNNEAAKGVSEDSNLKAPLHQENDIRGAAKQLTIKSARDLKSVKVKSENGSLMKDIPLDQASESPATSRSDKRESGGTDDQMLQLRETAKQGWDNPMISEASRRIYSPMEDVITCHHSDNSAQCPNSSSEAEIEKELGVDKLELSKTKRERNQEGKRRKILERLSSDAQRLNTLKISVEDLKKKAETNKRSKKNNDTEYEAVRQKIKEAEEAVVRLVDANDQLIKNIEESSSSFNGDTSAELAKDGQVQRKRVMERARRESEQIGRLQFEVQNMQYILLKLADEKKNIGKNRFSKQTGILLMDFIQNDQKSSGRRGKVCFCGCSRPSTNEG